MKINIRNLQKKIPVNPKRIKSAILKLLSKERVPESGEITVCFTGDKEIRELNRRFLDKDIATDVLAFDLSAGKKNKGIFCDIVISSDTAIRNSKTFKTTPGDELYLYVVHGLLHLIGYDDRTPKERQLMRKKEKEYANT